MHIFSNFGGMKKSQIKQYIYIYIYIYLYIYIYIYIISSI